MVKKFFLGLGGNLFIVLNKYLYLSIFYEYDFLSCYKVGVNGNVFFKIFFFDLYYIE